MTNKQAIEWLIAIKKKYIHGGDEGFDELRKEALDMAVKALEEERPQGEWINMLYHPFGHYAARCNKCNVMITTSHISFCPNCGARMEVKKDEH